MYKRQGLGVVPSMKTVDTCAAEFESATEYHYKTYELSLIHIYATYHITLDDAPKSGDVVNVSVAGLTDMAGNCLLYTSRCV